MADATSLLMARRCALSYGHLVEDIYHHFTATASQEGESRPYLARRLHQQAKEHMKTEWGLIDSATEPCSHFFMELARHLYTHWLRALREEAAAAMIQDSAQRGATEIPPEVRPDTTPTFQ